ncbi:MAG: helicase, partial [Pseudorhodoplanes sp.]
LAQIAGRAGRATRDGTFGTTGRCQPFDDELVQRLESHSFEPLKLLQWRNSELDFSSIGALQASLAIVPDEAGLTRAPVAEDIQVLEHVARDDGIRGLAADRVGVRRLWETCQVPDYRKIAPANHAELVATLFGFLQRRGTIPDDWFARQVEQADRTEGDIDTLSTRIAHVRTWTFVANRPDWLADPEHWQGVTRAVEDKLSDALHERLSTRFVDRRTSVLMRRLRENTALESEISKTGEVTVEGHLLGRLEGFRFAADPSAGGSEAKALQAAAQKALAGEIEARAAKLSQAPDDQFVLASDNHIRWTGDAVGVLVAGEDVLRPRVRILADEQLTGSAREAVQARLDLWVKAHVEKLLGPLVSMASAEDITGIARGVAFQLVEALGVLDRHKVADEVKGLDQPTRAILRKHGVRFGAYHIYIPGLLKPGPRALAAQRYAIKQGGAEQKGIDEVQALAASGRTSIPANKEIPKYLYRTAGYRVCGERAVRVDILERLADLIRPALAWRANAPGVKPQGALDGTGFTVTVGMTSLVGSSGEDFASILRSLGYRMEKRPKPAEAPAPETSAAADTAPQSSPDTEADAAGEAATAEVAVAASAPDDVPASASDAPALTDDPVADGMVDDVAAVEVTVAPEAGMESASPVPAGPAAAETAPATEGSAVDAAPAAAESAPAAEPEMIEVWRPGRFDGQARHRARPRHEQRRRHGKPQAPAAADASAAPAPGEATQPAADAAAVPQGEVTREQRRPHRPHRGERHKDRREGHRPPHHGKSKPRDEPRRERPERKPDPNSPFAKLAALKEQLEAGSKERR